MWETVISIISLLLGVGILTFLFIKGLIKIREKIQLKYPTIYKYSIIPLYMTVLIQLMLITTYSSLMCINMVMLIDRPAGSFMSLINIVVIIPYNLIVSLLSGYKGKKTIAVATISGVAISVIILYILLSQAAWLIVYTQ